MHRPQILTRLLSIVVCALAFAGCEGCAGKANQTAASAKREAIEPRLQAVAQAHPDRASEVEAILADWGVVAERETYNRVRPLMEIYSADHPADAEDTRNVMDGWRLRLDEFEPAPTPPPN